MGRGSQSMRARNTRARVGDANESAVGHSALERSQSRGNNTHVVPNQTWGGSSRARVRSRDEQDGGDRLRRVYT